jgi:hypothetical protein
MLKWFFQNQKTLNFSYKKNFCGAEIFYGDFESTADANLIK